VRERRNDKNHTQEVGIPDSLACNLTTNPYEHNQRTKGASQERKKKIRRRRELDQQPDGLSDGLNLFQSIAPPEHKQYAYLMNGLSSTVMLTRIYLDSCEVVLKTEKGIFDFACRRKKNLLSVCVSYAAAFQRQFAESV